MPPYTIFINYELPLQVKYHTSQMNLLYNWIWLSIWSVLYWNNQPCQKLNLDWWKWWQATHIEKHQKWLHLHIYWTNILTDIVPWKHFPPYFHLAGGSESFQPSLYLLQLLKTIPGCQNMALQQNSHNFSLPGHTS